MTLPEKNVLEIRSTTSIQQTASKLSNQKLNSLLLTPANLLSELTC